MSELPIVAVAVVLLLVLLLGARIHAFIARLISSLPVGLGTPFGTILETSGEAQRGHAG